MFAWNGSASDGYLLLIDIAHHLKSPIFWGHTSKSREEIGQSKVTSRPLKSEELKCGGAEVGI